MKCAKNVKKVEKRGCDSSSYSENNSFNTSLALVTEWSLIWSLSITAIASHTGSAASMSWVEKMIVLP